MNEINNLLEKIRNAQYALESIPEPAQQEIEPLRHRNRELRRIWYERRAAYIDQIPHFWATTVSLLEHQAVFHDIKFIL